MFMKMTDDEKFMGAAIREARKAAKIGEVPIGAVIVYEGRIIGRGYNKRNTKKTTLAHAELEAILKADKKIGDWRLEDCTIYITLEPCQMCAGALVQARIKRCVVGCMSPKAGCAGSVLDILRQNTFNHQVEYVSGIRNDECSELLKEFFKNLRIENALIKKQKKQNAEEEYDSKLNSRGTESN